MAEQGTGSIAADGHQAILSPEQVSLELPIAGPASRMLAYLIDFVLVLAFELGILFLVAWSLPVVDWLRDFFERVTGLESVDEAGWPIVVGAVLLLFLVMYLAELVYFVVSEMASGGRSIGKALVGLRVMRDGGLPITLQASLMRNVLRIVDALPSSYVLGLAVLLTSEHGKRLGDLAAGTIVVRLDRAELSLDSWGDEAEDLSRFRFDREQLSRMGASERRLIVQTLRRLPALEQQAERAALQRTTAVIRERIGYDEPLESDGGAAFLRALERAARRR